MYIKTTARGSSCSKYITGSTDHQSTMYYSAKDSDAKLKLVLLI